MNIMTKFGDFLLAEWLWNVTWGWYHIPLTIFCMCLLFKWLLRVTIIPAVLISFLANIYALGVYSLFVVGILIYLFNFSYDPTSPLALQMAMEPYYACLYLGIIYTVLHASFFLLVNMWYKLHILNTLIVTFMCNMVCAWLVYLLLPNPLL